METKTTQTQIAKKGDFVSYMLTKVQKVSEQGGVTLTPADKTFAQDILLTTYKKMMEDGTNPNSVEFIACNFPGQVKRFARLGMSLNDQEIYVDIRNNGKTGKKDINLKLQYQGEEKILIKFCKKNGGVVNIIKDVIMEGEELITARDFSTGNFKIQDHKIPNILKRQANHTNKDKVIGAYAIAYHQDGTQTAVIIDAERIARAYNASPSQTKTVWKADYSKMVKKTAVHELFKELNKFVKVPDELLEEYHGAILDQDEVETEIRQNANKEVFDAEFEVVEEPEAAPADFDPETGEVKKPQPKEEPAPAQTELFNGPAF